MAEITRRRTGELWRELFNILWAAPAGLQASAALQALAQRVTLTPYEAAAYESGGRRFDKIVRFATVDCVKAGWLVKDKGIWIVTDEGRQQHATLTDPEAFYRRAVQLYNEWRASQPDAQDATVPAPESPETLSLDNAAKAVSITFEGTSERMLCSKLSLMRRLSCSCA